MLFNSLNFLIFFPVVTILYFLLPHKLRWFMLLAASCVFYMAFIPKYILILAVTITVDYFVGILLVKMQGKRRKIFLIISIISNIGFLFMFKYFNFMNSNIADIARFFHWNYSIENLKIILPIGLSFHTFQSLSYIIEVYRGKQKAEYNFGIFALYVMFYPQLVAGPIERPQNLLHQFREKHYFEIARVTDGLKMMLWGLFKKVVIADRLAIFVNVIYNHPHNYKGISLVAATIFFAFQIYCDFSGYSDIARGAAKVMGFDLMVNFNRPYLSKSISEFWKRWHISLSTWFKDYVYISLGGNRVRKQWWFFNLFITFLLSGFWHGANWTYLIWGGLNGIYLVMSIITENLRGSIVGFTKIDKLPTLHKFVQIVITFGLISFAWIFFRANNLKDAIYIIKSMFTSSFTKSSLSMFIHTAGSIAGFGLENLMLSIVLIGFLIGVEIIQRKLIIRQYLDRYSYAGWSVYYVGTFTIIIFGIFTKTQFIYFQF
jgi:alginate O-acetyltransferase complex protein AlgI